MNETIRRILSYVVVFIVGAGIATGTIYYTAIRRSNERIRAVEATVTQLTDANNRLSEDYQRVAGTAAELEGRLRNRQEVINGIASAVDSMSNGLSGSADLIQAAIDTISRIEYLLHN